MSDSSVSIVRIGIIIGACCDVPPEFLAQANIIVIPIPIKIGQTIYIDHHNPQTNARYMSENIQGQGVHGHSESLNAEQMHDFFLEKCALDFDQVYCLTTHSTINSMYAAATQGLDMALSAIRKARHEADMARPFVCRVVDTRSLFAGEGIAAFLLHDFLQKPLHPIDMFKRFIKDVDSIHTYITADDVAYVHKRISTRGDHILNWPRLLLGKTLNIKPMVHHYQGKSEVVGKFKGRNGVLSNVFNLITEHIIARRLKTPHIIISHADALGEIYSADTFSQLRMACEVHKVHLHIVPMSITGMMNFGLGSLSVAFAATTGETGV